MFLFTDAASKFIPKDVQVDWYLGIVGKKNQFGEILIFAQVAEGSAVSK